MTGAKPFSRWLQGMSLPFCLFLADCAQAAPLQISGTVTSTFFVHQPASQAFTNVRSFQACIQGNAVSIRVNASSLDQGIQWFGYVFDGTNSFSSTQFEPRKRNTTQGKHPVNDSTLVIRPQPFPQRGHSPLIALWLAFGSSAYFSRLRDDSINLFNSFSQQDAGPDVDNMRLRADWRLSPQPPFLLQRMVDYLDGDSPDGRVGTTNSIFLVTQWTNANHLLIPRQFSFVEFVPDAKAKSKVVNTTVGIVTNVAAAAATPVSAPGLTDATRIVDYRYRDVEEVRKYLYGAPPDYVTTNHQLWSVQEIVHDAIEKRRHLQEREPARK